MRRVCVMLMMVGLGACAAEEPETRAAALQGADVPNTPGVGTPNVPAVVDSAAHLGLKTGGPEAKPVVRVRTPDWASARKAPAIPATWTQELVVSGAPLPVLLPGVESLVRSAKMTQGEHWYAASMRGEGHSVYIQGTRTSTTFGAIELDPAGDALTRAPYVISRSHQIVTLGFERFGLGYHIDIECERPMEDARCVDSAYAISIFEGLAVAGGAR